LKPEFLATLGLRGNLEARFAINCWNLDFRSQSGLTDGDWDGTQDVISLSRKKGMGLNLHNQKKVTGRTTQLPCIPLSGNTHPGSLSDPGGNLNAQVFHLPSEAATSATGAITSRNLAGSMALPAGNRKPHALTIFLNLPDATTHRTGSHFQLGSPPRSLALGTDGLPGRFDAGLSSPNRIQKGNF
jgi:hypothetical protein